MLMQASTITRPADHNREHAAVYRAMCARHAELEAQVIACITRSWHGAERTLLAIERIGNWYLTLQYYGWMQCAVFRIHYRDTDGEERSRLREYGIRAHGGPPQLVMLDGG